MDAHEYAGHSLSGRLQAYLEVLGTASRTTLPENEDAPAPFPWESAFLSWSRTLARWNWQEGAVNALLSELRAEVSAREEPISVADPLVLNLSTVLGTMEKQLKYRFYSPVYLAAWGGGSGGSSDGRGGGGDSGSSKGRSGRAASSSPSSSSDSGEYTGLSELFRNHRGVLERAKKERLHLNALLAIDRVRPEFRTREVVKNTVAAIAAGFKPERIGVSDDAWASAVSRALQRRH